MVVDEFELKVFRQLRNALGVKKRYLLRLKVKDISFKENNILLRSFDGFTKIIELNKEARNLLMQFIKKKGLLNEEYVFLTHYKTLRAKEVLISAKSHAALS